MSQSGLGPLGVKRVAGGGGLRGCGFRGLLRTWEVSCCERDVLLDPPRQR
jgi:hypothetical protein